MPCLEISMPKTDLAIKRELSSRLTEVFVETTGHEAEIFGIRFLEYEEGDAASGGRLCETGSGRPYLHFLLYCPRLKRSVKASLVEGLSNAFVEVVGRDGWLPVIHLCEHPYDNVGVQGKLLSDSYDACANAKFYYELPKD